METIKINGLSWDAENLKVFGSSHCNQIIAKFFVKIVGKRLPTKEEFDALAELPNVWDEEKKGRWFAENEEDLKNPEKSLFFPAVGYRHYSTGTVYDVGLTGHYWSSTTGSIGAFALYVHSGRVYPAHINDRSHGLPVRCIEK